MKGPEEACVQPISPSMRNLSGTPDSKASLLGVNKGTSVPSMAKATGEGEEETTCTGGAPRDDDEVEEGAPSTRTCPERALIHI